MKILYYSPHPHLNLQDFSGYGTHMREMIGAFRSLGHEVLPVIAGGTEKNRKVKNTHIGYSLKKILPGYLRETIKDFLLLQKDKQLEQSLLQQVELFQPDLIYERGAYLQLSGCNAARKSGVRHVVEINAPLTDEKNMLQGKSLFSRESDKMEKELIAAADKILVVSSRLKEYYTSKFNGSGEKFLVVPNAVNLRLVKPDDGLVNDIRSRFNLQGKMVIGFVGSIFKYHGVDILIDAFNEIASKAKDIQLMIVGDGEISGELKLLAENYNISDKVIFTGNVKPSETFSFIEVFDIAVLPRTKEYMSPIKIFEYGSLGKAIVAADVSSVRDVMTHGVHGILVQPGKKALAEGILQLINDSSLRKTAGENFRKKILSEHTWEKMARKILSSVQ